MDKDDKSIVLGTFLISLGCIFYIPNTLTCVISIIIGVLSLITLNEKEPKMVKNVQMYLGAVVLIPLTYMKLMQFKYFQFGDITNMLGIANSTVIIGLVSYLIGVILLVMGLIAKNKRVTQ